jgi:aminoglycoside phosphotransferase family enzyme/gluconate kinase
MSAMRAPDSNLSNDGLLEALRDPSAYPHPVGAVDVIETHISSVLLAGDYAYKIKKPVQFGFVDFSTLDRRRACCEEEIRLNRRTAPSLYLGVVPITRRQAGLRIGGEGSAVEYAVRMRRFGLDARLDQLAAAGKLDGGLIDRLAATIAKFHAQCERVPERSTLGTAASVRAWVMNTVRQLRSLVAERPVSGQRERVDALADWIEAEFERRAAFFDARRAAGFVRECHGDLHLANIALVDGAPMPFDCIEFNPELRFIDVMSDVAFTWMDLLDHRLDRLAARFLNRYLEETGDYDGLALLRFCAVYRALVRALVALIRRDQTVAAQVRKSEQDECGRYLEIAERLTRPQAPLLVAVCGVSGSGKTTVARELIEQLGAVCVRSDVERKRLAGLTPAARTGAAVAAGLYADPVTRATYRRLAEVAAKVADAGFPGIVDATFQRGSDRQSFAAAAAQRDARCAFVLCEASPATLRARVAARSARGNDASDATLPVLARQLATFELPNREEAARTLHLSTDTDPGTLAMRCAALATTLREVQHEAVASACHSES